MTTGCSAVSLLDESDVSTGRDEEVSEAVDKLRKREARFKKPTLATHFCITTLVMERILSNDFRKDNNELDFPTGVRAHIVAFLFSVRVWFGCPSARAQDKKN